jgi:hypothetical protein
LIKIKKAMESNRRQPEDSDFRHRAENHRVGQELYRRDQQNQNRHPQEQYPGGQQHQNRQQGYNPDQAHYGSRPDSAYRNPNINFGDNPYRQDNDHRYDRPAFRNEGGTTGRSPYPEDFTRPEQHHDNRMWTERNRYKDEDYRYRSGHRDTWERPANLDYNEDDRARQRGDYRGQQEGFFDRIGNTISHAWHHMTQDEDDNPTGNLGPQNRDVNRGYDSGSRWGHEAGPRWGDDRDNDRYRQRRFNRDDSDRY